MASLNFGTLKFGYQKEYYIALGIFCNSKAFSISYEPNKSTGSYADAYRMRKLSTAKKLIKPIEDAIRSGNRINCNNYVVNLIEHHNFIQNGKAICGTLENVVKTVPESYLSDFIEGFTKSAIVNDNSIVVYEAENIKSTATSLKKTAVPKSRKTTSHIKGSVTKGKTKHDYIKEHIRNTDIGDRGEKLVYEMEKKKLIEAGRTGKISSINNVVQWVSLDDDSAGYDILSYDIDTKQKIYIEVKTTTENKMAPFYMSEGEIEFSKKNPNQYRLYRVFNFKKTIAEYFELKGDISLSTEVLIDAVNYKVTIK